MVIDTNYSGSSANLTIFCLGVVLDGATDGFGVALEHQCFCDSYECSDGYTLVDDAEKVECEDNICKKSQCCEPACSQYTCPKNCTPKGGSSTIKCHISGCNTDTCCFYD